VKIPHDFYIPWEQTVTRSYPAFKPAVSLFALLLSLVLSACHTLIPAKTPQADEASPPSDAAPIQVVRYGRYTMVELTPAHGQRDLMAQVVDVSIPLSQGANDVTVGEALRYVLQRSGYRLCDPSSAFDVLPLPLAHAHLGPMQLRDALTVLAGSAWKLQVNETTRQVCFISAVDTPSVINDKVEASA